MARMGGSLFRNYDFLNLDDAKDKNRTTMTCRNNNRGTIACFAIRKQKVQNMNKEAPALAFCFVGYLSGGYVFDSGGAVAITAAAACASLFIKMKPSAPSWMPMLL